MVSRASPSAATRCSWSPEPPAASSRPSSPTSPPPPAAIFHLLDRVPEPMRRRPRSRASRRRPRGLKRDLAERLTRAGRAADAGARRTRAGARSSARRPRWTRSTRCARPAGRRHYHAVDLVDPVAVAAVVDEIRRRHGRIDVLRARGGHRGEPPLPDKKPAASSTACSTSSATAGSTSCTRPATCRSRAVVVFSSIAGRFGNRGQTDYSAANDLLCKWIAKLRTTRPATRAIAIDWTAWAGIGMASRGSIPTDDGRGRDRHAAARGRRSPIVRRELTAGGTRGEVVDRGPARRAARGVRPRRAGSTSERCAASRAARGPDDRRGRRDGRAHRSRRRDRARPAAALPRRPPHRRHARASRRHGHRGVRGAGLPARARLARARRSRTCASLRRSSSTATSRAARGSRPCCARTATGSSPTAGSSAAGRCQGSRRAQVTTHFTARVRLDAHGAPARAPRRRTRADRRDRASRPTTSTACTSTVPPISVLERVVARRRPRSSGSWRRGLPPDHLPRRIATRLAPRLIELCFQTAGHRRDRHARVAWGCPTHRAGRDPGAGRVDGPAGSSPSSSRPSRRRLRRAGGGRGRSACTSRCAAIARSSCRHRVADEQIAPLQAVAGLSGSAWTRDFAAHRHRQPRRGGHAR